MKIGKRGMRHWDVKFMDLEDLLESGILQEVNRRFFHPLGLCLAVRVSKRSGKIKNELRIVDHQDDPEGTIFGPGVMCRLKFDTFNRLWNERVNERIQRLGYVEQPVPAGWDECAEVRVRVENFMDAAEEKGVTIDTGKIEMQEARSGDRSDAHPASPPDKFEPDPALVEAIRFNLWIYAQQEMNLKSGDLPYRLARQLKIDAVI